MKKTIQTLEEIDKPLIQDVRTPSGGVVKFEYPSRIATWFANLKNGKTVSYKQYPKFDDMPFEMRQEIVAITLRLKEDSFTISRKRDGKHLKGFFYMQREDLTAVGTGGVRIPIAADRIGFCYNRWGDALTVRIEYIYKHNFKKGSESLSIGAKRDIYQENIRKKMEWYNLETHKFEAHRIVDVHGNMVPGANMDGALHRFGVIEDLEEVGTPPLVKDNKEVVMLAAKSSQMENLVRQ